ncbi:MAG: NADH-quinone oxidoreductase subunit C [Hyphomicrobiaceae bacterium]
MTWLGDMMRQWPSSGDQRPYPRIAVDGDSWQRAARHLAAGEARLLSLWGAPDTVHMALESQSTGVLSLACPDKRFPSVARMHLPALRLERSIHDLYGLVPEGSPDQRGWLDHGRWGMRYPLGERAVAPATGDAYAFHTAEGPPMHQIPVGPVHAGIIEPGHFRFSANGETVVRLEQRLGYVHKGIDGLMTGAPLERATKLAARVSGDSTVAYSIAFARAVEAALEIEAPGRALWLAALMAELERLANHLGDIGAICNDASFSLLHAHCGILREHVLRASNVCFGHRLMMDRIVPGGVTADLGNDGVAAIRKLIATIDQRFPELIELYDNTTSLQDRTVATGILSSALATQYGAGGYIGRASGSTRDVRKAPGYVPYTSLEFEVPTRHEGDVDARVWVRIEEVKQSLRLIEQILDRVPDGAILTNHVRSVLRRPAAEGLAFAEGFRGEVLAWVRIGKDAKVARCHLRDPSWFQWPLLEAAIEGNIVADFPLCNKSFNCSYSGHDL